MPNRYIRASAIESEAVNSLQWQAEVFYRRLLNRVDDFGRFTANNALLRAAIFPLQTERVRETDLSRLLAECEKAGLLYVYTASGKQFLVLQKWERGRALKSEYPRPPADICLRVSTYVGKCWRKLANVPDSDSDSDSDADSDADKRAGGAIGREKSRTMPPALAETPGFRDAWERWLTDLTERNRGKLPTSHQLQLHLEKLLRIATQGGSPIAAIDNAIARALREPDLPLAPGSQHPARNDPPPTTITTLDAPAE